MSTDIFQLDWIFIDTIIIVLLIFLLLGVKLYKLTHRWRFNFSNEALEHTYYNKPLIKRDDKPLPTNKWSLTSNYFLRRESNKKPTIVILRTNYKKKLLFILTEGLCSYGFNVVNLRIKKGFDKTLITNIGHLTSSVIKSIKNQNPEINFNFISLTYSKSSFSYKSILTNPKNYGMIVVNPKINDVNIRNYSDILESSPLNSQIFTIFSKRSIFVLKNKNFKRFLNQYNHLNEKKLNLFSIKKANYKFNYYETILLGMIIDIINNKLLNMKT